MIEEYEMYYNYGTEDSVIWEVITETYEEPGYDIDYGIGYI